MRLNLDLQPYERKRVSYYAPSPIIFIFLIFFTILHYSYQEYKTGHDFDKANTLLIVNTKEYKDLLIEKNSLVKKKNNVSRLVKEANSLKHRLSLERLSWYTLFIQLEQAIPSKMSLTSLSYSPENIRTFIIKGEAESIENIIHFTENLLKNKYFEDVTIVKSEQFKPDDYKKNIYSFEIKCRFIG